jgi:dihydrofolate reductase
MNKPISLIAAIAINGVIGDGDDLPWRIPSDLEKFKATTLGGTILMGRKTFESIGRPLPNRRNIVITTDENWSHEGVEVVHNFNEAFKAFDQCRENFIIGGSGLFDYFYHYAQKAYITHVMAKPKGNVKFPISNESFFNNHSIEYEEFVCGEKDEYPYVYRIYTTGRS